MGWALDPTSLGSKTLTSQLAISAHRSLQFWGVGSRAGQSVGSQVAPEGLYG